MNIPKIKVKLKSCIDLTTGDDIVVFPYFCTTVGICNITRTCEGAIIEYLLHGADGDMGEMELPDCAYVFVKDEGGEWFSDLYLAVRGQYTVDK